MDISKLGITKLKEIARDLKIPKYYTYKKKDIDTLRSLIVERQQATPAPVPAAVTVVQVQAPPVEQIVESKSMAEELREMNITSLKVFAKKHGVPRYSKYNKTTKHLLEEAILQHVGRDKFLEEKEVPAETKKEDLSLENLLSKQITQLKQLAKELGIPQYYKYNRNTKDQLARAIFIVTTGKEIEEESIPPSQPPVDIVEEASPAKETIAQLRKKAKDQGISVSNLNRKQLTEYIAADKCSEDFECGGDKICDVSNNKCIEEKFLDKNLTIEDFNGKKIAGVKHALDDVRQILESKQETLQVAAQARAPAKNISAADLEQVITAYKPPAYLLKQITLLG